MTSSWSPPPSLLLAPVAPSAATAGGRGTASPSSGSRDDAPSLPLSSSTTSRLRPPQPQQQLRQANVVSFATMTVPIYTSREEEEVVAVVLVWQDIIMPGVWIYLRYGI